MRIAKQCGLNYAKSTAWVKPKKWRYNAPRGIWTKTFELDPLYTESYNSGFGFKLLPELYDLMSDEGKAEVLSEECSEINKFRPLTRVFNTVVVLAWS